MPPRMKFGSLQEVMTVVLLNLTETIASCRDTIESQAHTIAELTARAEQAERERDAVAKSVDRLIEAWENFKSPALTEFIKQWRGLQPQDGRK